MTCPLCGTGVLPGKICLYCGYDPHRQGFRPPTKPSVPDSPKSETAPPLRDVTRPKAKQKTAKLDPQEKTPAKESGGTGSDADDILDQIDRLGPSATAIAPSSSSTSATSSQTAPQAATVPVTTQFVFERRRIVGYAGLVTATVVVRVGEPDDLLPNGEDLCRLKEGPIGLRMRKAIDWATADLKTEALERGANGVVGVRLDIRPGQGPFAVVTLIGTAVVLET